MKFNWRGALKSICRILALVVGLILLVDLTCINAIMFHPPGPSYDESFDGYHDIGTNGICVAAMLHETKTMGKVVLYCHGNAEEMASALEGKKRFLRYGISIASVDYPGYGLSNGSPDEAGCYETVHRLYDWLCDERGYRPEDIIVYGFSIGTGPALELATSRPVGGLILQAPFLSATRVITRVRLLPVDPFQNINRIHDLSCPLLVLHGTDDAVIPHWHGKELYEKASVPKQFVSVPGANHNDLPFIYGIKRYDELIVDFVASSGRVRGAHAHP